ncbi:hypothetical protein PU707_004065 [Cronobacter sakazakii]|uniref:hypothetical protein n=1 Tax=Cronobacter sakazakii TaxID=28141 RepID=UPI00029BF49B|nr:hypothetical protein [Cronobacter sakazakii]CCK09305.1 hypothetical protein BN128_3426 [Cronobacter sakazakii 696]EJG0744727.1 hypothetical protein [Cronobacter sakazakii]EJG0748847.1 hypothetical protein [Cronobacter sakazakii]EKK3982534.1 hypothetical protein [Cronobacter sakazakii]EKK3985446.1 hypothetical protein [Cronobacter sakazakii]
MFFLGFLFFQACALYIIWKGPTSFTKKQWLFFVLKLVGIFLLTLVSGSVFYTLAAVWGIISFDAAEHYNGLVFMSFSSLWGVQFIMVGLSTKFTLMMKFHEKYNQANYPAIKNMTRHFTSGSSLVLRVMLSLGSALIYYGVWIDQVHPQ